MPNEQLQVFKTKEDLIQAAIIQSKKVDQKFENATYLYFLARFFVSIFESRYGEIPIQVWNEYRNALDHFFRHLTSEKEINNSDSSIDCSNQLKKMEGHLQRAVLDITKIHCHRTQESIEKFINRHSPGVLTLIDNGNFYPTLLENKRNAEEKFEVAKIFDSNLGEDAAHDIEVLGKYLEATFAFDNIKYELIKKAPKIQIAINNHKSISKKASVHSTIKHYIIHMTFYLGWTVVVALSTLLWESKIRPLLQPFLDRFGS